MSLEVLGVVVAGTVLMSSRLGLGEGLGATSGVSPLSRWSASSAERLCHIVALASASRPSEQAPSDEPSVAGSSFSNASLPEGRDDIGRSGAASPQIVESPPVRRAAREAACSATVAGGGPVVGTGAVPEESAEMRAPVSRVSHCSQ